MTMSRSTQSQFPDTALGARVDALVSDIAGVKKDVHELRSFAASRDDVLILAQKVEALTMAFSAGQRTNWTPMIGAAGVFLSFVIAVSGLAYWPLYSNINEVKAMSHERLTTDIVTFVPRREIEAMAKSYDVQLDALTKRLDRVQASRGVAEK